MGDFSGYTIQQCGRKNIRKAYVVGFIGKLAKWQQVLNKLMSKDQK